MQKITSLQKTLENNPLLKDVTFVSSTTFRWDHTSRTIFYAPHEPHATHYLLHEAGHALLDHSEFLDDVSLVGMERAAWDKAILLGKEHAIKIDNEVIEDALDSYRDWIHTRATCPECSSIGLQSAQKQYTCLACHAKWKVNEARGCALRRYKI